MCLVIIGVLTSFESSSLKVFVDSDWARNVDDRKITSSGAFFLGTRLVSWTSKKKNCISQSTTEVEYVATTKIIQIKKLLKGMKEEITDPMVIYCDRKSSINISKNHVIHTKRKHVTIKYHYLRELVQEKEVKLEYVNT